MIYYIIELKQNSYFTKSCDVSVYLLISKEELKAAVSTLIHRVKFNYPEINNKYIYIYKKKQKKKKNVHLNESDEVYSPRNGTKLSNVILYLYLLKTGLSTS